MSFIFGGDTGMTWEEAQAKRQMAEQLAKANMATPRNVGEGLNALGRALAYRGMTGRADKAQDALRGEAESAFADIMGGLGGAGAAPPPAMTQNDAMAANGGPTVAAADALVSGGSMSGGQQEFINAMMPHALRVSEQTGLDPRLVIAQAAQETGWGRSAPNNNFFGIKSHGRAGGSTQNTHEYVNGQRVNVADSFRAYSDMGQSADDYARFLQENPRYRPMLAAGTLEDQVAALGQSGYATDPNYARSVMSIAQGIQLPQGGSPAAAPQGGVPASPVMSTQSGAAPAPAPASGVSGPNMALIQQLAQLSANPALDPGRRALVGALLQQQMQAMQPQSEMDRLALERARIEVDRLRNPQPDLTGTQREYEFARQQGFEGSFLEYQTALAEARRSQNNTNVNVGGDAAPGLGKLSTDFGYVLDPTTGQPVIDPETGLPTAAPVPGSKAALEVAAAAEANENAEEIKGTSTAIVLDEINLARELIQNQTMLNPTTGISGSLVSRIDSTNAGALKNRLMTVKANLGFDKLQSMRDASPTGGALGQVSEFENRLLQAVWGSLEQAQRSEDLLYNLDRLENIYNRVIHEGIPEDEARALYLEIERGAPAEEGDDGIPTYNPQTGAWE